MEEKNSTISHGVQFREQRAQSRHTSGTSKMIRIIVKLSGGLIKNERQANLVLLGIVVVCVLITFLVLRGGGEEVLPYDGGSNPEFQTNR